MILVVGKLDVSEPWKVDRNGRTCVGKDTFCKGLSFFLNKYSDPLVKVTTFQILLYSNPNKQKYLLVAIN